MKLESLLKEKGIHYEKSTHQPVYTSQGLAAKDHVSGYYVAKPVIVKSDQEFAMCVVPACARVNLDKVAQLLKVADVRLASEQEMAELFTDCELGAEPPLGSLYGLKTIADRQLHQDDYVVMQSGTHVESIRISRDDWETLCHPVVAEITHPT